jgi:hypothetical protein
MNTKLQTVVSDGDLYLEIVNSPDRTAEDFQEEDNPGFGLCNSCNCGGSSSHSSISNE